MKRLEQCILAQHPLIYYQISTLLLMSSQHKSSYEDDPSFSESNTEQLIEDQFNQIFVDGVDPNLCFYKTYCRLYIQNLSLISKVEKLTEENRQLEKKMKQMGKQIVPKEEPTSHEQRKKRCRRTAGEIARHYTCKYQTCQKSYGSQGSLNQHIKLKHNGVSFSK